MTEQACGKRVYKDDQEGTRYCGKLLNDKGRCPNAENHIVKNEEKPAQRGKLTKNDSKAGDTFLREARNNAIRAQNYFLKAAELYESSDRLGDAKECRDAVDLILKSQEYVRYIDRH